VGEAEARLQGARLQAVGLTFAYPGRPPVLRGIDLDLEPGTYLALLGQNGAGKTTLAKHFNGLLRATQGQTLVDGQDASRLSVGELAHKVGYVFQNPDHQIFSENVADEIRFGPQNLGFPDEDVADRVDWAMNTFGLRALAGERPATLGFGLRRKVALASVLAMGTPALILDEPTTGLDRPSAHALMATVGELAAKGRTVVIITHDTRLVADFVPDCAVLHEGELLGHGPTGAVLRDAALTSRAGLELPQVGQLSVRLGMTDDQLALSVRQFIKTYTHLRAQTREGGR
jgi:energy-coupling factor transport system ATP-binding protein